MGHAIQHQHQMPLFKWRSRLVKFAVAIEKVGVMALMAIPFVGGLFRIPHPMIALLGIGVGSLLVGVMVHLVTLPVEWDASFKRALPVLIAGKYIPESAIPIAKQILTAAALTYLAASLASILNFYRWLVFLRR